MTVGSPYRFPSLLQAERGPDRWTTFDPGPFAKPIEVRQVIFPTADGSMLAWQVEVHAPSHQASYVLLVDATTGTLLYRTNTYRFADGPLGLGLSKEPRRVAGASSWISPVVRSPRRSAGATDLSTVGNNVQADSATSVGDFTFPFTDAWKILGVNPFDLEGLRLRFTPTDGLAREYTLAATTSPIGSTEPSGFSLLPLFANTDDGTINLACIGWAATVLGGTFTSLWVNTNGSVSFGSGSTADFPSKVSLSNGPRRIAGLWRDLHPGVGGTLTGSCAPEGMGQVVRIVWNAVPNFGGANTHTFAIVVHGAGTGLDNVIDIDYGTVTSSSGELVGLGGNTGTPFNPDDDWDCQLP